MGYFRRRQDGFCAARRGDNSQVSGEAERGFCGRGEAAAIAKPVRDDAGEGESEGGAELGVGAMVMKTAVRMEVMARGVFGYGVWVWYVWVWCVCLVCACVRRVCSRSLCFCPSYSFFLPLSLAMWMVAVPASLTPSVRRASWLRRVEAYTEQVLARREREEGGEYVGLMCMRCRAPCSCPKGEGAAQAPGSSGRVGMQL